jgi:hypothetical protein
MLMEIYRWFWGILTIIALAWYSTITIYIAYRGVFDIQQMLKKLSRGEFNPDSPESTPARGQ